MNYESVPPPLPRVDDGGALIQKIGAVAGLAAMGALVCTLPAALRVSAVLAGDAPGVRAWAALGVAALAPMAVSLVLLRGARLGLRSFAPSDAGLRAFGAGLWVAALLVSLTLYGALLRATTHHRALAAITYACGALALAVVWALGCGRLVTILRGASEASRRLAAILLSAVAVAVIAFLGMRFARVVSQDASSAAAGDTVVDVLAFMISAGAASVGWDFARRLLAVAGPPIAVFLTALGITTLHDPPVREAIGEHAPVFVPVADLVSGR